MTETNNRKHLRETFLAEVRGYLAQTERFLDADSESSAIEDGRIPIYTYIHNLKGVAGLMEVMPLHQAAELLLHHMDSMQVRHGLTIGDIQDLLRDFIDEMSWMLMNVESDQPENNEDILRRLRQRWPEPRQAETRHVGSFTEELIGLFVTELFQGLSGLREALEVLSREPDDSAAKANIFRHCMNLRGSAAMIEIKPLEKVLHMGAELSERAEKLPHEAVAIWGDFQSIVEVLQAMAEQLYGQRRLNEGVAENLFADFMRKYPEEMKRTISRFDDGERSYDDYEEDDESDFDDDDEEVERELKEIFIQEGSEHLRLMADQVVELESRPDSGELLNQLFRTVHTLKGAAATAGYKQLSDMAHGVEDVLDLARENRIPSGKDLLDLLYHSQPLMRSALELEADDKRGLAPLLEELSGLVSDFTGKQELKAPSPVKLAEAVVDEEQPESEDAEEVYEEQSIETEKSSTRAMMLRVPMDKLDRLMDMISELEIGRERITRFTADIAPMAKTLKRERRNLNQTIATFQKKYQWDKANNRATVNPLEDFSDLEFDRYEDLQIFTRNLEDLDFRIATVLKDVESMLLQFREDAGDIGKSVSNLREEFISLRMIPVDSIFRYLSFQTRELSRKLGKKVSVRLYGETTSIDKGIADTLPESLMHMVRNALTHGIESPAERLAHGKKEEGTIWFRAYQIGRNVQIEIEDDGAGVNLNRVREIAVRSGLLSPGTAEHCDETRLLDLIFSPHITTRDYVDEVSGRGVGLDAVRHNIAAMYGSVKAESQETRGTKFTITLPLTLALQELLLVRASEQEFLIPMNYIEAVDEIEVDRYDFASPDVYNLMDYRGLKIGCRSLHQFTGMEWPAQSGKRPVIILRHAENRMGLLVDEIQRREELVVRPLPHMLDACEHLIGTTISAQGEVRLVLSVVELFQRERFVSAFDAEKFSLPERVKVLIADDSISVRQTIKRVLEKHGLKANTARDGMLAWQKLHSIRPNVMIIDLEMPGLNGYELIQRIKQSGDYDDMAILVLTSRGGNKHRDLAYRSGADGFLTKPVLEKTLISTLRGVLPLDLRELLDEKDQTIE